MGDALETKEEALKLLTNYHRLRKDTPFDYNGYLNVLTQSGYGSDASLSEMVAFCESCCTQRQFQRNLCQICNRPRRNGNDAACKMSAKEYLKEWILTYDSAGNKLQEKQKPSDDDIFRYLFELQEAGLAVTHAEISIYAKNAFKMLTKNDINDYITRWVAERRVLKERFDEWVAVKQVGSDASIKK